MAFAGSFSILLSIGCILLFASPAHGFGAGNIAAMSAIEGTNWRHGDIEDTLLQLVMSSAAGGRNFDKMAVARVYFGNWLRDYSQAIDVGTVKYVSAEAIRILLWVLGFMTFGYGTGEFEVTTERLGCYRPEDHIDNPKDYADNLDATDYDRRLRGPVNEEVELAIDPQTGMKNYIANERAGCMTSAQHVRRLFMESIRLGRSYARTGNKSELYESLRLLGTGTHCLEDFSAHSNYTELALLEMGERDVFPHVGSRTQMRLQGARSQVYPLITGTFGGVDFLHSMMGEFNDKATQSEIQTLEDSIQEGSQKDTSMLKALLEKIPEGLFGGGDQKDKADELQQASNEAAMQNMSITPKEPEEFTLQMQEIVKQIYPIMQYHDEIMQQISEAIEKIPVLPDLIEELENEINVFVFSLLAPFVLPLIQQLKTELNEGSSEIIASSKDKQHIVFEDDECTDPTHSMLSKDHFSNVLNEPAGKVASNILKWAVPQLIQAMDNENINANQTVSRIISGVFHHPAQRAQGNDGASECRAIMFQTVQQWWQGVGQGSQQDLRRQLSRDGVLNGENHKEGEHDTGHGSAGGLKMHKHAEGCGVGQGMIGELLSAFSGGADAQQAGQQYGRPLGRPTGRASNNNGMADNVGAAVGGGLLGSIVGGVLGNVMGGDDDGNQQNQYPGQNLGQNQGYGQGQNYGQLQNQTSYQNQYQTQDGGFRRETTELGRNPQTNTYQQQQYSETTYPSGRKVEEFKKFEQGQGGRDGGHGYEARVDQRSDGEIRGQERFRRGSEEKEKKWKKKADSDDDDDDDDDDKRRQKRYSGGKEKKWKKKHDDDDDDSDDDDKRCARRHSNERRGSGGRDRSNERQFGSRQQGEQSGYGYQPQQSYGRQPIQESYGGRPVEQPYGRRHEQDSYGRPQPEQERYGGGGGFREDQRDQFGGGRGFGEERHGQFGGGRGDDDDNERRGGFGGPMHGRQEMYGRQGGEPFGGRDDIDDERRGGYGEEEESFGRGPPGGYQQGGYGREEQRRW